MNTKLEKAASKVLHMMSDYALSAPFQEAFEELRVAVSDCGEELQDEESPLNLDAYEKSCIERALRESEGNRLVAASMLGIGKSTMYRKLKKHGLRRAVS